MAGHCLAMDLRIDVREDRFVVTSPDVPGARATHDRLGPAVDRLHALARLSDRSSPFATVQKRLAERHALTTTSGR